MRLAGINRNNSRGTRFNPHPTSQPDATSALVKLGAFQSGFNPHPTSQPDATHARRLIPWRHELFQPSSDLTAGCDFMAPSALQANEKFQPSSDLTAGCDIRGWCAGGLDSQSFNPHPTSQPDATFGVSFRLFRKVVFQPSSDLTAGCDDVPSIFHTRG